MNNRTVTIAIIVTLTIIALGFGAFYYFILRSRVPVVPGNDHTVAGGPTTIFPVVPPDNDASTPGTDITPEHPATVDDLENPPLEIPTKRVGVIRQLTTAPVAGAVSFKQGTSSSTTIRYIEKERGNLYDVRTDEPSAERISIDTIPRIHEAFFTSSGKSIVFRYLKDSSSVIETYRANILLQKSATSSGFYEIEGSFLPQNSSVVDGGKSTKFFYLLPTSDGAVGYTINGDGSQNTEVFTSPANEWLASWVDERTLTMTSKPASGLDGSAYLLDIGTKKLSKIASRIQGLTTLTSPDKTLVLYSNSVNNSLETHISTIKTGEKRAFNVKTLPEKCVWSEKKDVHVLFCGVPASLPSANYPDDWYTGTIGFSDEIWKIDLDTETTERIVATGLFPKGAVDVTRPFLTPDEDYMVFTNKKDLTLWSVGISD
jgi:hypothetical protein